MRILGVPRVAGFNLMDLLGESEGMGISWFGWFMIAIFPST